MLYSFSFQFKVLKTYNILKIEKNMSDLIDLVEIWLKKPNVENCVRDLEAKLLKDEVDLLSDVAYIRLWNEWRDQVEVRKI